MLGRDKRKSFVKVLGTFGKANSGGVGASTSIAPEAVAASSPTQGAQDLPSAQKLPTPTSTLPIEAVPLAIAGNTHPLAPVDKGKRVVVVPSSEEEDTADGPVSKKRRTNTVATSHSTSQRETNPPRENPPSAFTPPNYLALGEGVETIPEPTPTPA